MGKGVEDLEFVSMCRYLQEVLLFMQLEHGIKFGDIGLLRRLIDPLTVVFLGSGQAKYGYEMLHLRWLLEQADPDLQRAILVGGLVNERGRPDTFKPIDLVLEHINLAFARDIKVLKNSTHDVISTFIRGSLAHDELRAIRAGFELHFGHRTNTAHTYKSARNDVFSLAVHFVREGCVEPFCESSGRGENERFLSADVFCDGVLRLPSAVDRLNKDMLRLFGRLAARQRLALMDEGDDEADLVSGPDGVSANVVRDAVAEIVGATDFDGGWIPT